MVISSTTKRTPCAHKQAYSTSLHTAPTTQSAAGGADEMHVEGIDPRGHCTIAGKTCAQRTPTTATNTPTTHSLQKAPTRDRTTAVTKPIRISLRDHAPYFTTSFDHAEHTCVATANAVPTVHMPTPLPQVTHLHAKKGYPTLRNEAGQTDQNKIMKAAMYADNMDIEAQHAQSDYAQSKTQIIEEVSTTSQVKNNSTKIKRMINHTTAKMTMSTTTPNKTKRRSPLPHGITVST